MNLNNINIQAILAWIKANVLTVILFALMIAALIALPWYAASRNDQIRQAVESRARKKSQLENLTNTQIIDGQSGLVNQRTLEQYRKLIEARTDDSQRMLEEAYAHNRKGHSPVLEGVFPAPPPDQREVMPRRFHERLVEAYEQLFEEINAGTPPRPSTILEDIEAHRQTLLHQEFSKAEEDRLTDEERKQMRRMLSDHRIAMYIDAAENISLYADESALTIPQWPSGRLPSLNELFEWQWRYWCDQEILNALAEANAQATNVLRAPVKRLVTLNSSLREGARSGGRGGGGGTFGGGGSRGGGARGGNKASDTQPIDPKQPVETDYSVSITGRQSNHLYDVRVAELTIIADTERLPAVLNALAKRNFMTVLMLDLETIDPYDAVSENYFYGSGSLCRVTMQLETIWFRQWTSAFMPEETRNELGVPDPDSENQQDQPAN